MSYTDRGRVARQYRDASKLNARIALHERFSANSYGLQRWIFDQIYLPSKARVLDVGCGPARLWTENLDRIPDGWSITLADASPGMIRKAEDNLAGSELRPDFRVADARDLPFEDGSFDAVVANHILYHVPDRSRAFWEISRVLRPNGRLYAATNGQGSQREMGRMQKVLDPSHPDESAFQAPLAFSLENGRDQLAGFFSDVCLRRYEDALVVTESGPLVDYLLSGRASDVARETAADEFGRRVAELEEGLERELAARGEIRITKDVGMFVARR